MYRYLSGRLRQLGYDHGDLGRALGMSRSAISRRFTGVIPWTVEEVYKVLELCQATPEEFTTYFPAAAALKGKGATA